MPNYAVINPDGSKNWSRDSDLVATSRTAPGNYVLDFNRPCDQDVFVVHARTRGNNFDGQLVVIAALQEGAVRISLSVRNLAKPARTQGEDALISYVRYRKADEFLMGGQGQGQGEGGCYPCQDAKTRDWYSWINLMPPGPPSFYVTGEVYVPNAGVEPLLVPRVPQGINPEILLLDLHLCQQPGNWTTSGPVWKQARYEKVPVGQPRYQRVEIFCGNTSIADVGVEEIQ